MKIEITELFQCVCQMISFSGLLALSIAPNPTFFIDFSLDILWNSSDFGCPCTSTQICTRKQDEQAVQIFLNRPVHGFAEAVLDFDKAIWMLDFASY